MAEDDDDGEESAGRPERPGADATTAEKYEWMESDFGWSLAEGAAKANEEDGQEDGENEEDEE